jgi:uncharacterized protein GlcG (DUF336 family)
MTSARLLTSCWKRRDLIRQIPVAICCVLGARAVLIQGANAQLLEKKALTLAAARKMVAAAEAEAERNRLAGVLAVVDDGGWAILLERMDNAAYVASVELALGKARTAALFKKPSQALEDAIDHGRFAAVTAGFVQCRAVFRLSSMARSLAASARASICPSTTRKSQEPGLQGSRIERTVRI